MVKYTQSFNRLGSKTVDIKHFKSYLPTDVKIIVEPFCGTSAVSRIHYFDTNKYDYHLNDLDKNIYTLMNNMNAYIALYDEIYNEYNNIHKLNNMTERDFGKLLKNRITDESNISQILLSEVYNNIKCGRYFRMPKKNVNPNDSLIYNKAIKTNCDYKIILEQYKNNKDAFLFLDPPYLFSDNSSYRPNNNGTDITHIYVHILEYLKKCKCKVMLIINKLDILVYLFKNYIKGEYDRVYQLNKNITKLLIITNY